jgi:hypothetical protein
VRAKRDETISLDPPPSTQNLLDRARQIVIAKQAEHAAEPVERLDMRLQERLLGAVRERHRERRTGMTRTHMKQVDLQLGAGHRDVRLAPVDLGLHPRRMHLRHERLHPFATLTTTAVNVFPDRPLSNIGSMLITQPLPDPPRGVPLLARRIPVPVKPRVDQPAIWAELRCGPADRPALHRRQRRHQRLTHRPTMNTMTHRQRPDRQALPVAVPSDLLERLHS